MNRRLRVFIDANGSITHDGAPDLEVESHQGDIGGLKLTNHSKEKLSVTIELWKLVSVVPMIEIRPIDDPEAEAFTPTSDSIVH